WGPLTPALITQALAKVDVTVAVPELIKDAEARAGQDCDNVSAVAMTWADNAPTAPHQVSTGNFQPDTVSTRLEEFGAAPGQADMTDAEIERAIAEIRAAIRRNTP